MLLLIVNVFASVHESFLQLNVSGEPKVTVITYEKFNFARRYNNFTYNIYNVNANAKLQHLQLTLSPRLPS